MALDPRREMVEMVARLSRETQLHLDERHRHFQINKIVVITISLLLVILAAFNVYYVRILYTDLDGIVSNMDSMHVHMVAVDEKMLDITENVGAFEKHMRHMDQINEHTWAMAEMLPRISGSMDEMDVEINNINQNMGRLSLGMTNIEQRFGHMTRGVVIMRDNVQKISRPMGAMNPFMP